MITPILDSGPLGMVKITILDSGFVVMVTTPILDSGPGGYGDNSYSRFWSCGLW